MHTDGNKNLTKMPTTHINYIETADFLVDKPFDVYKGVCTLYIVHIIINWNEQTFFFPFHCQNHFPLYISIWLLENASDFSPHIRTALIEFTN